MGVSTGAGLLWTRHWVVRSRIRSERFFHGVGFRQELSKAAKPPGSNLWNSSCWNAVIGAGCRYTQGGRNSPLVTSYTHCACTVWNKNVGGAMHFPPKRMPYAWDAISSTVCWHVLYKTDQGCPHAYMWVCLGWHVIFSKGDLLAIVLRRKIPSYHSYFSS